MNASPAILIPLLLGGLIAQAPLPLRGASVAWDAAFVFNKKSTEVQLKGRVLPIQTSVIPAVQGVNDFAERAVRAWLASATSQSVTPLQFDALTTSNDRLPITFWPAFQEFRVSITENTGWAALFVARDGLDVIGYYFENPSFPPLMRNVVYHELVNSDFVYPGSPIDPTDSIMGMDFAIPRIIANRGQPDPTAYTVTNRLYFSLTPASAAKVNSLNYFQVVDGATIFEVDYVNSAVSAVIVHKTGADFGLSSGSDIDALAMFPVGTPPVGYGTRLQPNSMCYIFSTDGQASEELMVAARVQDPANPGGVQRVAPLRSPNGFMLLGSGPGALAQGHAKGVCGEDPELVFPNRVYGLPKDDGILVPNRMSLSMWSYEDSDKPRLHGVLSGWIGAQSPETVELYMQAPGGVFTLIPLPIRSANDGYYSFDIPRPAGSSGSDYQFIVLTRPVSAPGSAPYISILLDLKFR